MNLPLVVRLVTIAVTSVTLLIGLRDVIRAWPLSTPDIRLRRMALLGMVFAADYGTVEALANDVPFGSRSAVVLVAVTWALVGYLQPEGQQMVRPSRRRNRNHRGT